MCDCTDKCIGAGCKEHGISSDRGEDSYEYDRFVEAEWEHTRGRNHDETEVVCPIIQ